MKHLKAIFAIAAAGLCAVACMKEDKPQNLVPVTVRVNDFSITQEEISTTLPSTKTTETPQNYSGVKTFTLAFFDAAGKEAFNETQVRSDSTYYEIFGSFNLSLPMGSYTMVVLGYGGEEPVTFNSMTEVTFGEAIPRETFAYTRNITMSNSDLVEIEATLQRIVAGLAVRSTDFTPPELHSVRVSVSKGANSFNPISGLATSDTGVSVLFYRYTSVGSTTRTLINFFLTSDEENMDVTVETMDENENVMLSKTITNVPFKRNRNTIISGKMFSDTASLGVLLSTDFLPDLNLQF